MKCEEVESRMVDFLDNNLEEKIYKELEKKHETWEKVLEAIAKAFVPFRKKLRKEITREDILKLTEKPVRRIYKLDIDELNTQIKGIETEIKQVEFDLANLNDFVIRYFENLHAKYGKGRERKTEIKPFDTITAKQVAIANTKIYVNRAEGFVGTGLKKDELLFECSDLDDIIVFAKRGTMKVVKVQEKVFIGKDILHAAVFQKNDGQLMREKVDVEQRVFQLLLESIHVACQISKPHRKPRGARNGHAGVRVTANSSQS
jgi:topoisomerase-4 subunit A